MALYQIPVTNEPDQKFNITMPINGVNTLYKVRLRYNRIANYWVLTLADKSGNIILDGIPLVAGDPPAANIFGQFAYLGIGGMAVVKQGQPSVDSPDDTTLGTQFILVWGDISEFE